MKAALCLFALTYASPLAAQVEKTQKAPGQAAAENSSQPSEEQLSLQLLREALAKMLAEREAAVVRARRLELLLAEITAGAERARESEEATARQIAALKAEWDVARSAIPEVPLELIAHYESRDPAIAAQDFRLLFQKDERVAIALIRTMKKKKSAALIDQLAGLGQDGKDIAARIAAAIGNTGQP
jgi:hypothetical protein